MSNLDDIFNLQEQNTNDQAVEKQPEKKQNKVQKRAEMSDEKKMAMLERLRAGREKRQENLKVKKGVVDVVPKKPEEIIIKEEKKLEVKKEQSSKEVNKTNEDERLSFINMMAGKSKPIENNAVQKRPKKKVYSEPKVVPKEPEEQTKKPEVINKEPKNVSASVITAPVTTAPIVITKQPIKPMVIIRTFKKPIWA